MEWKFLPVCILCVCVCVCVCVLCAYVCCVLCLFGLIGCVHVCKCIKYIHNTHGYLSTSVYCVLCVCVYCVHLCHVGLLHMYSTWCVFSWCTGIVYILLLETELCTFVCMAVPISFSCVWLCIYLYSSFSLQICVLRPKGAGLSILQRSIQSSTSASA